jgi:hypothetical protein
MDPLFAAHTRTTNGHVRFISRADAAKKLQALNENLWWDRLRNYEYEERLHEAFGGDWCISEWCPFDGRWCTLRDFLPPPWPPMVGEESSDPNVGVPWRNFDGSLTSSNEVATH